MSCLLLQSADKTKPAGNIYEKYCYINRTGRPPLQPRTLISL